MSLPAAQQKAPRIGNKLAELLEEVAGLKLLYPTREVAMVLTRLQEVAAVYVFVQEEIRVANSNSVDAKGFDLMITDSLREIL